MPENYRIERISQSTISSLVALYNLVFKKNIRAQYLHNKYETSAFGIQYLGYIAFSPSGLPIAFYGVLPCQFKLKGQIVLAAQSADTMTHPEYRKQGWLYTLAQKTYELAKVYDIKFIFGFPNQNSLPGFKKLGWQFQKESLLLFIIDVKVIPFAKLSRKSNAIKYLYNLWADIVLRNLSIKNMELKLIQSEYGVLRNKQFCSYKTYNKTIHLTIGGLYLWIAFDGILKVGLMDKINDKDLKPLYIIAAIKKLALRLGCSKISFITHKNSFTYSLLSEIITPKDCFQVGFYNIQEANVEFKKVQFEYCDIDIF
jgi:hypothetical protein